MNEANSINELPPCKKPHLAARAHAADAWFIASQTVVLLGIVLAVKAVLLPFPVASLGEFARWCLRWWIVASADVAFVAVLGVGCYEVGTWVRRWGRGRRVWRWGTAGLFQVASVYAVCGVPMFRLLMVPLSVELLSFAGGPALFASSLAPFLTPQWVTLFIAAPLALAAAGHLVLRRADAAKGTQEAVVLPSRWPTWVAVGVALLAALQAGVCRQYICVHWTDPNRWERRIAQSPHAVFVGSCVAGLFRGDWWGLSFDPTEVDETDFAPTIEQARKAARRVAAEQPAARWRLVRSGQRQERPKNLIVVVLESVGVEYLSLYGAPYDTTPQLARLAAEGGIVFDAVYAHAPSSPKGLVALTASVLPRVDWRLITRDNPQFHVPTLAEVFSAAGYRSAYLHSGDWGWKCRDRYLRERGVQDVLDASTLGIPRVNSWGVSDRDLFQAALDWIDRDPERPFHLLLWTIETHHPYVVHKPVQAFGTQDAELERYLNAVRAADANLAWLMDALRERRLDDATVVAITGDHGEGFGQHGQRVHSFGVYEENVHVPWILLDPSLPAGEARFADACRQVDIPATLVGQLGLQAPAAWQGRDVLRQGAAPRAYFFSVGNEVLLGVREGQYKYHFHVQSGAEELFDLVHDPDELQNLAGAQPNRCVSLRRRVAGMVTYQRRFLAAHGAP